MSLPDPLTAWSSLLFQSLVDAGIREVVLSPGSRSTPFVLAAAARPELKLYEIVDERSAAFFALGQARVSGRPALLLCTSGTAGAHYLPAMVEASQAFLPVIALTSDRPLELQDCGAPQTIDQTKLFGDHVRAFIELGAPDDHPAALAGLRRKVAQAVHRSLWPTPGPVHLNARARKPLEPREARGEGERRFAEQSHALGRTPFARVFPAAASPSPGGLDALQAALARAERPLFVAGPAPLSQRASRDAIGALVSATGGVLLADGASQLRFGDARALSAFALYLALEPVSERLAPDLVVQLGGTPVSAAPLHPRAEQPIERWVVALHGWNDAENNAAALLVAEPGDVARALLTRLKAPRAHTTEWQQLFGDVDFAARRILDEVLDAPGTLTEPSAVRAAVRSLSPGDLLAVGNSLPIREVDLFCSGADADCGVLAQRGANGIDGLLSGAAGAASMGAKVTLLLGDVSFLHDLGGLWAAGRFGSDLRVVVLQNGGGRIFEDLPLAEAGVGNTMALFTTPHEASLEAAAGVFGLPYRRAETSAELARALARSSDGSPACLIEVVVPPRSYSEVRRRLAAELERRLPRSPAFDRPRT
jgi:2-succinyl-5-enolpyruvyl-6-hydroxy-3-cyclohexene-1-carboxylate synthase